MECVVANDDSCSYFTSAVQWKAEESILYYIKVYGHGSAIGNFGLSFSSASTPGNDDCNGAIEVTASNTKFVGTNYGATSDQVPLCGLSSLLFPGSWYKVQGRNSAISVSTCTPTAVSATLVAVYVGSCGSLICVTGGNTDLSCGTEWNAGYASWFGEEGFDYYILVQSQEGNGDGFDLNVSESNSVDNDFCPQASNIQVDGSTIGVPDYGTLEGATSSGLSFNDTSCAYGLNSPDVWYSLEGTGDIILASICTIGMTFGWTLSVFRGPCNSLECIRSISYDSCGEVRWRTISGEKYYIMVQGNDPTNVGTFSISFRNDRAPLNDLCQDAELIDWQNDPSILLLGATTEATEDQSTNDSCFTISSGGDVWYKVIGGRNDATLLASTCHPETNFDTQLSVYRAFVAGDESCTNLECVVTNDDACGANLTSQVSWTANANTTYYVRVHGSGQNNGNFALSITEMNKLGLEGNCENALEVNLSESFPVSIVEGNTIGLGVPLFTVSPCNQYPSSSDTWFQITSVPGEVTVSTCGEMTEFDTFLEVFQGSCDILECVDFNDDDLLESDTSLSSCSTVSWAAEENVDYFVRLTGYGSDEGAFEIMFSLSTS